MEIKILFFGILAEETGKNNLSVQDIHDTESLIKMLMETFPRIKDQTFRIAVNQVMISENTKLQNGDEVALLPPFAGG